MHTNNIRMDTFFLEMPKADIPLLKSLVKRLDRTVHKTTAKRTAYEQTLDNKEHRRINEYTNADDLFTKTGCLMAYLAHAEYRDTR